MGRLFWKTFFLTLIAQAIAAVAISAALQLSSSTRQQTSVEQTPLAGTLNQVAATALQFGGMPAVQNMLKNVDPHHSVCIVSADNVELTDCRLKAEFIAQVLHRAANEPPNPFLQNVATADGQHYLVFTLEHPDADNIMPLPDPTGALRPPPPDERAAPRDLRRYGPPPAPPARRPGPANNRFDRIVPLSFAVLFSLVIAGLAAWYFSKPINQLRSAFAAVAQGDLSARIGASMATRHDELSELGRDFDAMVSQLDTLIQGHKKLLNDVSHELRSPLARLQLAIGLARQQPDKSAASLQRIENEGLRMEHLVDELLILAKLEAGLMPDDSDDIFLNDIVAELADNGQFEAGALGLQFEIRGEFDVVLHANAALLYRAIENVLRNALKHTAPHSLVQLTGSIDSAKRQLELCISDQGAGLPDAELLAVFDPFYRSKANDRQVAGVGLGLAIARRIVGNYGGSISAHNQTQGGLCVQITLPYIRREAYPDHSS